MDKIYSMNAFLKIDGLKPSELRQDATKLPGHAEIGLHMVFDIKMDGKIHTKGTVSGERE